MLFDPVTLGAAVQLAKAPATIKASVEDWLDDHPEATTTVQDGSITKAKLHDDLADEIDDNTAAVAALEGDVGGLKSAVADLEEGSLSALNASAGQVPIADGAGSWTWDTEHTVTGVNPVIVALAGHRYICGEVETISITPPASGICDVVFESGTTPAVLTVPNTVKWPDWFNPANLETSATYELNILDGVYGAVGVWT